MLPSMCLPSSAHHYGGCDRGGWQRVQSAVETPNHWGGGGKSVLCRGNRVCEGSEAWERRRDSKRPRRACMGGLAHPVYSVKCLPVFPWAQSTSLLLSTLNSFQRVLKVSSFSSTWLNPCWGRYVDGKCQFIICNIHISNLFQILFPYRLS